MSVRRLLLLLMAGLWLTAAASVADARKPLLAGDDNALWVVLPGGAWDPNATDANGLDVLMRPAGAPWQRVASGLTGRPWGAAVSDGLLHLILHEPLGHVIVRPERGVLVARKPSDARWTDPRTRLAITPVRGTAGRDGPALLAVLCTPAGDETSASAPATAPRTTTAAAAIRPAETAPADDSATRPQPPATWHLVPYLYRDAEWMRADHLPDTLAFTGPLVRAATVGKTLYVWTGDTAGESELLACTDGRWAPVQMPAPGHVVGLANLAGQLAMVLLPEAPATTRPTTAPAGGAVLALLTADGQWVVNPIDAPKPLDSASTLSVAEMGAVVGVLDTSSRPPRMLSVERSGQVVKDIAVELPPAKGQATEVMVTFLWVLGGAMVATLLASMLNRPGPRLFLFPPGMAPASPARRLAAFLVDLLPWYAITGVLMVPGSELTIEKLTYYAENQDQIGVEVAYAYVLSLTLFTMYAFLMEWRFGATIGKMLLRLRVIGMAGSDPRPLDLAVRNVWKPGELLIPPALPLLPLYMLINRNRQRVGDMFAGTAVVDSRQYAAWLAAGRPLRIAQTEEDTPPPEEGEDSGEPLQPPSQRPDGRQDTGELPEGTEPNPPHPPHPGREEPRDSGKAGFQGPDDNGSDGEKATDEQRP